MHQQQIKEFEVLKKFTHALAAGKDDVIEATTKQSQAENSSAMVSKKSWVEEQMHASCTKDIVLLCKEQLRHDKLLGQLTSMLTDLIKVNLQREMPIDQNLEKTTQLRTAKMFEIDRVASSDAKTFLNTRREVEESLLAGENNFVSDAEHNLLVNQYHGEKSGEFIDITSPVLSLNTRLDTKEEILANITAN